MPRACKVDQARVCLRGSLVDMEVDKIVTEPHTDCQGVLEPGSCKAGFLGQPEWEIGKNPGNYSNHIFGRLPPLY